jgi:hypothetical protein
VHVDAENALREAEAAYAAQTGGAPQGALHGLPISFKDTASTVGFPTTFGSRRAIKKSPGTATYRHGSVTTEQLIDHVESSTKTRIRPLVESWLFYEALPALPKRRWAPPGRRRCRRSRRRIPEAPNTCRPRRPSRTRM